MYILSWSNGQNKSTFKGAWVSTKLRPIREAKDFFEHFAPQKEGILSDRFFLENVSNWGILYFEAERGNGYTFDANRKIFPIYSSQDVKYRISIHLKIGLLDA